MWLPFVSAFLGTVAFLPTANTYWVACIFLVPLFLFFVREERLWRLVTGAVIFRLLFLCGTVYFALEPLSWLSALLIFTGLPITIWLVKKLIQQGSQTSFFCRSDFPFFIFLPFAWTFFDLLQARYTLMPTAINTAGNALGSSPFLGLAALGGLIALTFFVALINTLITALFTWRFHRHAQIALRMSVVALFLFGWQISQYALHENAYAYNALPYSLTIATVSTDPTFTFDQFGALTQELASHKVNLIIFPENMFNSSILWDIGSPTSDVGLPMSHIFQNVARELSTSVLAAYDTVRDKEKYNSAVLFDAQGAVVGVHDKNRLTVVGEYWPFGNWHPSFYEWLKENDPSIETYAVFDQRNADTPGERNLLSLPVEKNVVLFAAPICLEIHYPVDLGGYRARGAQFIVNQSSNRWMSIGRAHLNYLTTNLKKIESVSLSLPIISSGVDDSAGIILPNGDSQIVSPQTTDKKSAVFFGAIRY